MAFSKPTGPYAQQMVDPDGWPAVNEGILYDRAQQFTQVLRQVTDVLETCQQQKLEIFKGGIWSGGAADVANNKLGSNVDQLTTLQNDLATVVTWHKYVAGVIEEAKSVIGDNVLLAQTQIGVWESDPSLDDDQRNTAINNLVGSTHDTNTVVVAGAAQLILESPGNWKAPNNALENLLNQKVPPPVTALAASGATAGLMGQSRMTTSNLTETAPSLGQLEGVAANAPTPGQLMATAGQVGQLAQEGAPVAQGAGQGMQQVMQMTQGMQGAGGSTSGSGSTSAQLAKDSTTAQGDDGDGDGDKDKDKDKDGDTQQSDTGPEARDQAAVGATAGPQASPAAPVGAATSAGPATTASATTASATTASQGTSMPGVPRLDPNLLRDTAGQFGDQADDHADSADDQAVYPQ